jgi:hypothetical protein
MLLMSPELYDLLDKRLGGVVRVENQGTPREEHVVVCPFCNDSRGHLYVNAFYGARDDDDPDADNLHLAHCFRGDCLADYENRRTLAEMVFGFVNVRDRDRAPAFLRRPCARPDVAPGPLTEVPPPGQLARLSELHADHPALAYLRGRDYDLTELEQAFGVAVCVRASPRYPLAGGRVIIPYVLDGKHVGWLARYAGELDWKQARVPRYYSMPGMPKSHVLYNFDRARDYPFAVVTEGPSKVWAVGPQGVGLMGKSASEQQMMLLLQGWQDRPAVVMLDGNDPDARGKAERLGRLLRQLLRQAVVVRLPDGVDPGDEPRDLLWGFIARAAREQDVALPTTPWYQG